MRVLRQGAKGADVKKWQLFLIGQGHLAGKADGDFGPLTDTATKKFQAKQGLTADGVVGHQTLARAMQLGMAVLDDADNQEQYGPNWPARPQDLSPLAPADRFDLFGRFTYRRVNDEGDIKILGDWVSKNLVTVTVPQLGTCGGGTRITFHQKAANQLQSLWAEWEKSEVIARVLTWGGSFCPRLIRGGSSLSNHAFGTAFDINMEWNGLGAQPALFGQHGCVRELVEIANRHGFFWGGHYNGRLDGMHFEVAKLL